MAGITIPCYGACKSDPKWRDPDTGLGCTLCGCSGKVTTYSQRELAERDYEEIVAKRKSQAARAQKKRRVA